MQYYRILYLLIHFTYIQACLKELDIKQEDKINVEDDFKHMKAVERYNIYTRYKLLHVPLVLRNMASREHS